MVRRFGAAPAFGVALLALAMVVPGAAWAAPTDPELTPTSTALTVTPSTSFAGQDVRMVAEVTPVPDGGQVQFTLRDAATGAVAWDHVETLDGNGRVILPDTTPMPGAYVVDATFLGSAYYAASTSAGSSLTVEKIVPTVTLTLHATQLVAGQSVGFSFTISPSEAGDGHVELLIDGDPYFAGRVGVSSARSKEVPGTLQPGIHEARIRFTSKIWKYGVAISQPQSLRVGDTGTPASGVHIDFDRISTPGRDVVVGVGREDAEHLAATHVRFSNDATMDGGVLQNGQTFEWSDSPRQWTLSAGADGTRTIWVQWKRPDGSWSLAQSDSIYLDTTGPSGSFVINNGDERVGDMWDSTLHEQTLNATVGDASLSQPGGTITNVGMSNDGHAWTVLPFAWDPANHTLGWNVETGNSGDQDEERTKTVYMKWRDAAGNWSPVVTDTIELYWNSDPAYLLIEGDRGYHGGGANPYFAARTVTLTFPIRDMPAEGIERVRLRGQSGGTARSVAWQPGLAVEWSLTDTAYGYTTSDGMKSIYVEMITKSGRRAEFGDLVFLDRAVPTSTSPQPALAINSVVDTITSATGTGASATATTTAVSADIRWAGKDKTKVSNYRLHKSVNAGSWSSVTLTDPTIPRSTQLISPGSSFKFRARSVDAAGNVGSWQAGATFGVVVRQETHSSLVYRGPWQYVSREDALGGRLRTTTSQGASVKMTFTGRAIAVIAPRGVNGDSFDVYVDGVRVKVVHLSLSSGYHPRRVVFSMAWNTSTTHTIRVVKKYNNGYTLPIDAFVILN